MLCLPHSGSGASIYKSWIDALGPSITVLPIQLPGRESRFTESMPKQMDDLVSQLIKSISPLVEKNTVTIFGHSFGGLLAFECAKILKDPKIKIVVSAAPAPNTKHYDFIHQLSDEEFLRKVINMGGVPAKLLENQELLSLILPTLKADIKLSETYFRDQNDKILGDILLLSGAKDRVIDHHDILGWSNFTLGKVVHVEIEGDHFYHLSQSPDIFHELVSFMG